MEAYDDGSTEGTMRETGRRGSATGWAVAGGLALVAALGVTGAVALTGGSGDGTGAREEAVAAPPRRTDPGVPPANPGAPNGDGAADTGDGSIPSARQLTPFDTGHAALRRLDPALLKAVQAAAKDAKEEGVDFFVTSGWRSRGYQQRLLDEGVEKYGSLAEARKFVETPDGSQHVTGRAIDIGSADADRWLIREGARYGLCQIYANELWHFELREGKCPVLLRDASR
ncbi:M15 family metallopeptidase [Streptomyces sp. NPDC087440]|uniref:M15 family metallopeptidase n=1 Tax=Streptomyces sp. NPDC087440 TaxID=3365790 RepID=UPI0037F7F258